MEDIELNPGQTVVIKIMPGLEYRITHTGWVLEVVCSQSLNVKPVNDKAVTLTARATDEAMDEL